MDTSEEFPGLGERLKKYRLAAGLSADELARKTREKFPDTGVSRQIIFNIEKGRRDMKLGELFELSMTLNINPTSLICDKSKPFDVIEEGPLKGYLPGDVDDFFWTYNGERDSDKGLDFNDLRATNYGSELLKTLDEFKTSFRNKEYSFCIGAVDIAKQNIEKLQEFGIAIPENVMQQFKQDEGIASDLASRNSASNKQEHQPRRTHR